MRQKAKAMVLASFVGDSLALGVHWIYDAKRIVREFGRVERFLTPKPDSYHPTKRKGQFTHYGDQAYVLLQSLADRKTFDLADFAERWRGLFAAYTGYYDGATKGTLKNFADGAGPEASASPSNDLAGAARIAPLVFCLRDDPGALVAAARAQTAMTHGDPLTIDAAELFARAALRILGGESPLSALATVAGERFTGTPLARWVKEGVVLKGEEGVIGVGCLGQSCHTPEAFPSVIQLVARYEDDLKEALVQNVMAGGDSAARGMAVGMLLGAHLGESAIPELWLAELERTEAIRNLLEKVP
ncbi:MAG: ADP-ribosylglycohydrolase family protein [Deltaproteobacteria bacterium]|nr:ADP-ribosylglycohydrolase family protein [Deltaproteobacteria bacterium]